MQGRSTQVYAPVGMSAGASGWAGTAETRRRAGAALAAAVLRGEPDAERRLIERILPHMKASCRMVLRGGADVDDALQVSFMKVLEGLSGYRAEASLERWARRITVNACFRLLKQRARHRSVHDDAVDPERMVSPPARERLSERLPRHVLDYLDRLSEDHRRAIILRHVYGYSLAELAELLDAPVDTVKSRLLYARRQLRRFVRRDISLGTGRSVARSQDRGATR